MALSSNLLKYPYGRGWKLLWSFNAICQTVVKSPRDWTHIGQIEALTLPLSLRQTSQPYLRRRWIQIQNKYSDDENNTGGVSMHLWFLAPITSKPNATLSQQFPLKGHPLACVVLRCLRCQKTYKGFSYWPRYKSALQQFVFSFRLKSLPRAVIWELPCK